MPLKRLFDAVMSGLGLAALAPVFAFVGLLIKLDSPGPVFFRQERMGLGGRPFRIFKFRTMQVNASEGSSHIRPSDDPQVTRTGRFLRRLKIDEIPQLINVLVGDMSLVGPRPEVRRFVELFGDDYSDILRVRPGMTDLASLRYRAESDIISRSGDPERDYVERILPEKIRLAKESIRKSSLLFDLVLILKTVLSLAKIAPDRRDRRP